MFTAAFAIATLVSICFAYFGSIINPIRGGAVFQSNFRVHGGLLWAALILIATLSPALSICTAIGIFIGSIPGWGIGFGAVAGYQMPPLTEIPMFDKIATAIVKPTYTLRSSNPPTYTIDSQFKLRLWGVIWMTMRGALWGATTIAGALVGKTLQHAVLAPFAFKFAWFAKAFAVFATTFVAQLSWFLLIPFALFCTMGLAYLLASYQVDNGLYIKRGEINFGMIIGLAISLLIL